MQGEFGFDIFLSFVYLFLNYYYYFSGRPLPPVGQSHEYGRSPHDHRNFGGGNDLNRQSSPGRPHYNDMNASRNIGKFKLYTKNNSLVQ